MSGQGGFVEYGNEYAGECPRCGSLSLVQVDLVGNVGHGIRCDACQEWVFLRCIAYQTREVHTVSSGA